MRLDELFDQSHTCSLPPPLRVLEPNFTGSEPPLAIMTGAFSATSAEMKGITIAAVSGKFGSSMSSSFDFGDASARFVALRSRPGCRMDVTHTTSAASIATPQQTSVGNADFCFAVNGRRTT